MIGTSQKVEPSFEFTFDTFTTTISRDFLMIG